MPFDYASPVQELTGGTIPRMTGEALGDAAGGFVLIRIDNGVEDICITLNWSDAEDAAHGLLNLAREARLMEDDYREAQARHEGGEDEDGSCEEKVNGTCPVCS
jgi:hypothetical protein